MGPLHCCRFVHGGFVVRRAGLYAVLGQPLYHQEL